ncbi:retrovirus-related pol polyprotein from transposon 17.6 [Tanacetum coccineum]
MVSEPVTAMNTRHKTSIEFENEVNEILARHESSFKEVNATLQTILTELQALQTSRSDNHTHPEINPFFLGETSNSTSSERRDPHNHQLKLQIPKFDALLLRFGPTDFEDPSEALSRLRQTSDLEIYIESFENLSHRVDGLPEGFLIASFIAGLQDDIQDTSQPARFSSTMMASKSSPSLQSSILGPPPNSRGHDSPDSEAKFRRITTQDAREHRDKGLCYYCDEKFVSGHRCGRPQLFMIEDSLEVNRDDDRKVEFEPEIESQGVVPEISFHAISGTSHPRTLRQKFHVTLANQEKIECVSRCKALTIAIHGKSITADYYVLPVAACPIVLGVQWLETIGPITMDYKQLTMSFELAGVFHTFYGLKHNVMEALKEKELNSLQGFHQSLGREESPKIAFHAKDVSLPNPMWPHKRQEVKSFLPTDLRRDAKILHEPEVVLDRRVIRQLKITQSMKS